MKVLMINSVCGIRSTGRICTDLAAILEKKGHEVKIAYGREFVPKQFKKYAVRSCTSFSVKLHGIKARLMDGAGFGSKISTRRFIKWVMEYDPDVIHIHNLHGYYINVEILFDYLKKYNKRVIWTLHDCWPFTGHTAYCDVIKCEKWEDGCYNCQLMREYPVTFRDRSDYNWVKKKEVFTGVADLTIVTPSKWLGNMVRRSFLKEYSIKVINNGIDTNLFSPIKSNFRKNNGLEGKFVLLGVATSWDEMKGFSDYLKLAEVLGDSYRMVLVGVTKDQKTKLPKNVLGIERTSDVRELAEIYTTSDLFLNLSYCENYPTVNIEAMSCGTPVLTYKTGGSPESVEKFGGIVVEQGNLENVINKIQAFGLKNKYKLEFDRDIIDKKNMLKEYLSLYEKDSER